MLIGRFSTYEIVKHDGFSPTILDSFVANLGTPKNYIMGVTLDGEENVISFIAVDTYITRMCKFQGFSATVTDSFDLDLTAEEAYGRGVSWDGSDLIAASAYSSSNTTVEPGDKIYKFQYFSSTILDSFQGSDLPFPWGVSWRRDGNLLVVNWNSTLSDVLLLQGFSPTVIDSFDTGLYQLVGVSADIDQNTYVTRDQTALKFQGFSSTLLDSFSISEGTYWSVEWSERLAASVVTYTYHGETPAGEQADNIRFKAADDNVQDFTNTIKIPTSGSNYSYWKHVAPVAVLPPANFINNVKFYVQGSVDWPGCTLRVAQVANYSQAIGTQGVTGAEASANHPDHPTMVDVNNYTQTNPLRLSGSIGNTTGKIIDGYLLMQLEVTPSATAGITSQVTFVWEYDEA